MPILSRLYQTDIASSKKIVSAHINAEFNQLINGHNDHENRVDDIEGSAITLAGIKTFNSGIKTDIINEVSLNAGVTIDGALIKDGAVPLPRYSVSGPAPTYTSASTITIPAGLVARDSTNSVDMLASTDLVVSLATSGALGLDTGSEAANTWYYLYLIAKSDSTLSAVLSATNEQASGSITLPTDYIYKRQLPLAVRNDSSSNILPFTVCDWGNYPYIAYRDTDDAAPYNLLTNGNNTAAFTSPGGGVSLDCSAMVPPISKQANFTGYVVYLAGSGTFSAFVKSPESNSTAGHRWGNVNSIGLSYQYNTMPVGLNATQRLAYRTTGNCGLNLHILGFWITEKV